MRALPILLGLSMLVACSDTGSPRRTGDAGGDDASPPISDEDGDSISDFDEGRAENVDTDGDGTPDYLDDDSDGDGIFDLTEAGDGDPGTPPEDADSDGIPNFRDSDSDGNGIEDAVEGIGDADGDGREDFRDLDNDEDRVDDATELGDPPEPTRDSDGDGLPDWLDPDSDNDFILDGEERPRTGADVDTDGDGTPDWRDDDSDNDGFSDAEEAGDMDIRTPPIDTDGDGIPNFRDGDSDGDGLADEDERTYGTDPTRADTDGDGVSDLVEVAACAGDPSCAGDPTNPLSNPRERGDFVFAEPYMMAPMPPRDTLDFATDIRVADVYFLVDTTGSMGGAITNVRSSLSTPTTGIIDQVRAMIPDVWFGVGDFRDYADSWLYRNLTDMTSDAATAQAGVNMLSAGGGGDYAEGDVPALAAVANGGPVSSIPMRTGCPAGTFGYPCFRSSAVPIVVLITDAPFHNGRGGTNPYSGYLDYATMLPYVTAARIRVIGVAVGTGGQADLNAIAMDTGAVDSAGAPLVSLASGGTVSAGVVTQIESLANATRFDINVVFNDDTSDAVDTWSAFVDHIEANEAGVPARGCAARPAEDTDGDGYADTFRNVEGGTRVCFDIIVKQNDTVMPTGDPQLFRATLTVLGDGFTPLDERDVFFLVPPEVVVGGPD